MLPQSTRMTTSSYLMAAKHIRRFLLQGGGLASFGTLLLSGRPCTTQCGINFGSCGLPLRPHKTI
eukprot:2639006-Prorocentrum_lima.AAC.1